MTSAVDAVVIGAGHNGLVAANLLAEAGWEVVVVDAAERAGGAIRSDETLRSGYVTDWFSAFYPLAAVSPAFAALELDRWGLRWRHAPTVLAHVWPDDRCAVLSRDPEVTAGSAERFAAGDGARWLELVEHFERMREPLLGAMLAPFPPVVATLRLLRRLGTAEALRLARFAVLPVRRFGAERFHGEAAPLLLAGNALHSDLAPEAAGSALYGWLLCMLGQTVGFPVPVGGSGMIVEALLARLGASGGSVRTATPAAAVDVRAGRVHGVRLGSGELLRSPTVLADVGAPHLYRDLVGLAHLPARLGADLAAFQWDTPTLKLNWALSQPIPWTAHEARGAGTVHLGVDLDGLTYYAASLAAHRMPDEPFVLLGQMTTADASRSPAGTESAWAYTHLPAGLPLTPDLIAEHVARVEAVIEARAPGFGSSVLARRVQTPADLEADDANLVHGAVGGGTAALHQQLIFRPIPGLGRAETPIDGLYLASAAAHPGGGVHGAPGAHAARAALARHRAGGGLKRALTEAALGRIYR